MGAFLTGTTTASISVYAHGFSLIVPAHAFGWGLAIGDPHGDVKPVQPVLAIRMQIRL